MGAVVSPEAAATRGAGRKLFQEWLVAALLEHLTLGLEPVGQLKRHADSEPVQQLLHQRNELRVGGLGDGGSGGFGQ